MLNKYENNGKKKFIATTLALAITFSSLTSVSYKLSDSLFLSASATTVEQFNFEFEESPQDPEVEEIIEQLERHGQDADIEAIIEQLEKLGQDAEVEEIIEQLEELGQDNSEVEAIIEQLKELGQDNSKVEAIIEQLKKLGQDNSKVEAIIEQLEELGPDADIEAIIEQLEELGQDNSKVEAIIEQLKDLEPDPEVEEIIEQLEELEPDPEVEAIIEQLDKLDPDTEVEAIIKQLDKLDDKRTELKDEMDNLAEKLYVLNNEQKNIDLLKASIKKSNDAFKTAVKKAYNLKGVSKKKTAVDSAIRDIYSRTWTIVGTLSMEARVYMDLEKAMCAANITENCGTFKEAKELIKTIIDQAYTNLYNLVEERYGSKSEMKARMTRLVELYEKLDEAEEEVKSNAAFKTKIEKFNEQKALEEKRQALEEKRQALEEQLRTLQEEYERNLEQINSKIESVDTELAELDNN